MVQNLKPNGPVSQEAATSPSHWHEQEALKDGSSADQLGNTPERIGPRREYSANGEAKPDTKKSPEEVAVVQDRVPEAKIETKTEAGTSSRLLPNWTVQFPKPNHSGSSAS
jgi:hypothetical protein